MSGAITPDGKIVAVEFSNISGMNVFALVQYLIPSIEISQLARDIRAKYFLLQ